MNWILRTNKKTIKAFLFALFLVFIFGLNAENSNAEILYEYDDMGNMTPLYECICTDNSGKETTLSGEGKQGANSTQCSDICTKNVSNSVYAKADGGGNKEIKIGNWVTDGNVKSKTLKEAVVDGVGGLFVSAIKTILQGIFILCGWLVSIAAILFGWVIAPGDTSGGGILEYKAIENVWKMVRDVLNMTFILVLLFAAFCTVFQIDKWNLKKVWLNILINALLVNFSFPIARFFIDISNVAMYYFLNSMYTGNVKGGVGIVSAFGNSSKLTELLIPGGNFAEAEISYIVAAIIFTFIFGMTMLVLAALFVVRMIALAMLVMFSPIGFVGYIFPKTSSFADDWWSNLFKYSFFGPIMVFMMAISLKVLEEAKKQANLNMLAVKNIPAGAEKITDPNWIAAAAFYTIPILILWFSMGMGKKMGIAGADAVIGSAKKWGGKIANMPLGFGKYAWRQSGIPGGAKKGWENMRKSGSFLGVNNPLTRAIFKDYKEERETRISAGMEKGRGGWKNALVNKAKGDFTKKAQEEKDNYHSENLETLLKEMDNVAINDKKTAMNFAGRYMHLMSDSGKKNEFEASVLYKLTTDAVHTSKTTGMSSEVKDAYYKKELSSAWTELRARYNMAQDVHTGKDKKGETTAPGTSGGQKWL